MNKILKQIWIEIKMLFDIAAVIEIYRIRLELQLFDYAEYRGAFFFLRFGFWIVGIKRSFMFEIFRTNIDKNMFGNKVVSFKFPWNYGRTGIATIVFARNYPNCKYADYIKFLFKRKEV
jgi:hypothetical protein